jgi:hypothetical protein
MKKYKASRHNYIGSGILIATLVIIALFCGRKAFGLWLGLSAKPSDPQLWGINLATTFPAFLLTLVTLGATGAIWYLLCELLTVIELTDQHLTVRYPGYKVQYQWSQLAGVEVLDEGTEDTPLVLQFKGDKLPREKTIVKRLLYPQAKHLDRLWLYPVLEDRAALHQELVAHLPRPS